MSENTTISPKDLKIILLFIISLVLIVVISYIDFFSFSNQVANEMISNSIPRLMGGIVFVVLMSMMGYKKIFKFLNGLLYFMLFT